MDKKDLMKLSKKRLAEAILEMGHIIRHLDNDNENIEYWTQDGEYIIDIPPSNYIELSEISSPHFHSSDSGRYYHHSHKGGQIPHGHHGSRYGLPVYVLGKTINSL